MNLESDINFKLMKLIKSIIIIFLLLSACQKSEDRACWKSAGNMDSIEIQIDSINKFKLYENIKYKIFQNSSKKIIIRGGENLISNIDLIEDSYQLSIHNLNKCDFLRSNSQDVIVEIHYPYYDRMYAQLSDSLIFVDTLIGDFFGLEMREGGGKTIINTNLNHIEIIVSAGPGSFEIGGYAKYATLKIQGLGFGFAQNLKSDNLYIYQNSRANLLSNFSQSEVLVEIDGVGLVKYKGNPNDLQIIKRGDGQCIPF